MAATSKLTSLGQSVSHLEHGLQPDPGLDSGVPQRELRPAAPIWTQHSRKYTNQHGTSRCVMWTTLSGTVVAVLVEASEEKGEMMSKSLYRVCLPLTRCASGSSLISVTTAR